MADRKQRTVREVVNAMREHVGDVTEDENEAMQAAVIAQLDAERGEG